MQRAIMHVDMNAFYATVEQHRDPSLRGKPVAVAGDPVKRNGIILAKSAQAKAAGVTTGEAIWQAQAKCPSLIVVPPHYDAYKRYARLARQLYYEYTPLVEPFGLDEAWLDVTGSEHLFGSPTAMAQEISERIKAELGLRVSIGLSWNKVFAKLGSDIDPGDGLVSITPANYRDVAWPLAADKLIYVGPATARKLYAAGFHTIGSVAQLSDGFCKNAFGGQGLVGKMLHQFAQGQDPSPVKPLDPSKGDVDYDIKGIGNGLTAPHDLTCEKDVRALVWLLAESVAQRLREAQFRCRTIAVGARFAGDLSGYSRQLTLKSPSCVTSVIAQSAMTLLQRAQTFSEEQALRSISIRVSNFSPLANPVQLDLFGDNQKQVSQERLEFAIDDLRRRFGNKCVHRAVELTDETMATVDIKAGNTVHPVGFLR